jgi:hypothetical protein
MDIVLAVSFFDFATMVITIHSARFGTTEEGQYTLHVSGADVIHEIFGYDCHRRRDVPQLSIKTRPRQSAVRTIASVSRHIDRKRT